MTEPVDNRECGNSQMTDQALLDAVAGCPYCGHPEEVLQSIRDAGYVVVPKPSGDRVQAAADAVDDEFKPKLHELLSEDSPFEASEDKRPPRHVSHRTPRGYGKTRYLKEIDEARAAIADSPFEASEDTRPRELYDSFMLEAADEVRHRHRTTDPEQKYEHTLRIGVWHSAAFEVAAAFGLGVDDD